MRKLADYILIPFFYKMTVVQDHPMALLNTLIKLSKNQVFLTIGPQRYNLDL